MAEIRIKCPTCGKILRLADAPNINQSTFVCPICKERHIVGKCVRIDTSPRPRGAEDTYYKGNSSSTGVDETCIGGVDETRIGSVNDTRFVQAPRHQPIGYLTDLNGRRYALRIGLNTIGRKANTSTATVQIDTPDRYMSRNHAVIDVRQVGGQIVHILKNGANKNPSYVNGSIMEADDQLIINDGDRLIFGKTEIVFKK